MGILLPRVHICFGDPALHLSWFETVTANRKSQGWWTINKSAMLGDVMIFYMIGPTSSFVASGTVASELCIVDDPKNEWYGAYAVEMKGIHMLPRFVSIREARERFPNWGFLRQPRRSTMVPDDIVEEFLSFLDVNGSKVTRYAEESDIEGTKTEVIRLTSKRSHRLRALAFEAAKGICCVCERDFTKILGSLGTRVLQVHHRKQLSSRVAPSVTKMRDLAVVCANCHLLLHLDAEKAMSIDKLRKMLQADGFYR